MASHIKKTIKCCKNNRNVHNNCCKKTRNIAIISAEILGLFYQKIEKSIAIKIETLEQTKHFIKPAIMIDVFSKPMYKYNRLSL